VKRILYAYSYLTEEHIDKKIIIVSLSSYFKGIYNQGFIFLISTNTNITELLGPQNLSKSKSKRSRKSC